VYWYGYLHRSRSKRLFENWVRVPKLTSTGASTSKDNYETQRMSEWIIPKKEDIDLTKDGESLHIWFESDDFGNRYISIEGKVLEYVKELLL
jgi:hypothetical protein